MPERISVGVITQAEGAHLGAYLAALAVTPEVERVFVADAGQQTFATAKEALGEKLAGTHADPAAMLREHRPALALVTLEAALAPPAIRAALEAGCHVLSEKPACLNAEDFAALTRLAQSKHLNIMLALANRVHGSVREARRLVADGALGKIYAAELHIVADQTRIKSAAYRASWFAQKDRAGGGHLIWLGIHWLDLAFFISGLSAEQVTGFTAVVGGQPIDVEDSAAIALRLSNGSLATLTSGFYLDKGYHSHVKLWGEHGWLELSELEGQPLEWLSTRTGGPVGPQRFEAPPGTGGYTPFVREAVRAAAGLAEPPITSEEGLHVLQTIFAAYRAAETGQTQKVPA